MMFMKIKNIFVLSLVFIILLSSQTVSADDGDAFNPFDIGADMVKNGLKGFVIGLGD